MSPGELADYKRSEHSPWEKVRVLVPFGQGRGDVLAVLLRLRDNVRVIIYRDGREELGVA